MSSRRSIVWLLFFIAMAVAAHVLVSSRSGQQGLASRPEVLVPGADRATLIEVSRRGVPAVVAVRSEQWRMVAPFPAAADTTVILRVLDALAFSFVTDDLTPKEMHRLGRSLADFGLTEPSPRLAVRCNERETIIGFGRMTPAGDGVYATVSDRPGVCIVASNVFATLNLAPDDLRNPHLLSESREPVLSVDVRRPSGKFVRVSRSVEGAWKMMDEQSGSPVSATRVTTLVETLSNARAQRFVWPVAGEQAPTTPAVSLLAGYGLDAESAVTVTLAGEEGTSRYVSFGKSADPGSVYALVQNGTAIATVSTELRDKLLTEADSFAELKLFPCEESSVTALSITDGETSYLLARLPEGGWRLDSPVSAPADADAVHALLQTILSLRTTERDPQGLLIAVTTNAPAVAVMRDAVLVQNRLEDLRSKTLLKLPADKIRRLTVTSAEGRFESAEWDANNRTWLLAKPEGATLNGLALAGVLAALDPLTARSVARLRIAASESGNYGLEKPRFTIAVDPADEGAIRRNILIGAPAPSGGVYATVGSTDAVVILSDESLRALTARFSTGERD